MTPNEFLNMTVADAMKMLTDNNGDSLEVKITKDDGTGILLRFSYEFVEETDE